MENSSIAMSDRISFEDDAPETITYIAVWLESHI